MKQLVDKKNQPCWFSGNESHKKVRSPPFSLQVIMKCQCEVKHVTCIHDHSLNVVYLREHVHVQCLGRGVILIVITLFMVLTKQFSSEPCR